MSSYAPGIEFTPNLGLQIPAPDSASWQLALNYDLSQLDLYLSGNLPLPELSTWSPTSIYAAGQTVIDAGALYVSIAGANQGNRPSLSAAQWSTSVASGGVVASPTYSDLLTDGLGDLIFANGDVISVVWSSSVAGGVVASPSYSELLTDGEGSLIFANGDVISVEIAIPN
jgi:hypothetical protein